MVCRCLGSSARARRAPDLPWRQQRLWEPQAPLPCWQLACRSGALATPYQTGCLHLALRRFLPPMPAAICHYLASTLSRSCPDSHRRTESPSRNWVKFRAAKMSAKLDQGIRDQVDGSLRICCRSVSSGGSQQGPHLTGSAWSGLPMGSLPTEPSWCLLAFQQSAAVYSWASVSLTSSLVS